MWDPVMGWACTEGRMGKGKCAHNFDVEGFPKGAIRETKKKRGI